jgi:murein L,D-transpeptidase YafK
MKEKPRSPARGAALSLILFAALASQSACAGKEDRIQNAFSGFTGKYVIYISKKKFLLEVFNRNGEPVAAYTVACGSNPDIKPKLHEGDNRTPEGLYFVNEILSMDADKKSPSYRTLRAMNKIFFRARDGHRRFGRPGVDLGDNAYGPRYYGLNYPNREDRERYQKALRKGDIPEIKGKVPCIGSGIAIHGNNDENSVGNLASNGCIRMYNRDLLECEQYIQMGTPVIISSE